MILLLQPWAMLAQSQSAATEQNGVVANAKIAADDAEDSALAGRPLSLEDALALAKAHNPRLQAAAARTAQSSARIQTAKEYSNPHAQVLEGHQSARDVANPGAPGLLQHFSVAQPLEIPAERRERLHIAQLARSSSEFAEQNEQLDVVADVKRAFYKALRQKEEVQHARENLALVKELLRRVATEVQVGEKGRLELTRAEAEKARASFMVRSAQIHMTDAIAALRAVIAAPPDELLNPEGKLEKPPQLPSLADLRKEMLAHHPLLEESQADLLKSKATLRHERTLRIPEPELYAEYENQPDLNFWRVGATVSLPLWNHRRGQIANAQAAISENTARIDQARFELTAELERAYEEYQLADQQVTSLEAGSLHEAESAVNAAMAAYHYGERGILEVLDAQRVLQSVRGDLLDARFARQSALVELESLEAIRPGGKH
jgi:cobalt-zinc-cadmium efflux system outer membrane protein